MSAQPIPLRRTPAPRIDAQLAAVEAAIDYLTLPTVRPPLTREDGVHVVVADGEQFAAWVFALGGDVNRAPALDGASLWTLRTETPQRADGSTVRIRVHVALVHDEFVPAEFRGAVSA
ncbi:hypothetical protein [Streptomyces sp. NBC_00582]|uniref:hypothetical protein n=1 Tax=Streptomyces sp. NBC_00582 TaxID=2975783 RepID=UPI002E8019C6|nr:hypothetical protein [Streptomyces sp. NBC_00582]WUB64657.1 hypothetical protein OG852_31765 [Streptomyces sp. NBC_00582]